jgi:hypothetical protein
MLPTLNRSGGQPHEFAMLPLDGLEAAKQEHAPGEPDACDMSNIHLNLGAEPTAQA